MLHGVLLGIFWWPLWWPVSLCCPETNWIVRILGADANCLWAGCILGRLGGCASALPGPVVRNVLGTVSSGAGSLLGPALDGVEVLRKSATNFKGK